MEIENNCEKFTCKISIEWLRVAIQQQQHKWLVLLWLKMLKISVMAFIAFLSASPRMTCCNLTKNKAYLKEVQLKFSWHFHFSTTLIADPIKAT